MVIHHFQSSTTIIRILKFARLRWTGYMAFMENKERSKMLAGNLKGT
jgi:hypothetical protein